MESPSKNFSETGSEKECVTDVPGAYPGYLTYKHSVQVTLGHCRSLCRAKGAEMMAWTKKSDNDNTERLCYCKAVKNNKCLKGMNPNVKRAHGETTCHGESMYCNNT